MRPAPRSTSGASPGPGPPAPHPPHPPPAPPPPPPPAARRGPARGAAGAQPAQRRVERVTVELPGERLECVERQRRLGERRRRVLVAAVPFEPGRDRFLPLGTLHPLQDGGD